MYNKMQIHHSGFCLIVILELIVLLFLAFKQYIIKTFEHVFVII